MRKTPAKITANSVLSIDAESELLHIDGSQLGRKVIGKNAEGEEITEPEPLLLKTVLVNALLAPEQGLSGEDSVARYELARRIFSGGNPVAVTPEEASLIRRVVPKMYAPLITGQVNQLIGG